MHSAVVNILATQDKELNPPRPNQRVMAEARNLEAKGAGRARQGSIRSAQWVGGGIVLGPNPEASYTLPKKVKRLAQERLQAR